MTRRFVPVALIFMAALASAECNKSSPTAPTPPQEVGPPSQPPAPGAGGVQVTVEPNPVPYSGKPITDLAACNNKNNTWYYDQLLKEVGGVQVTFTKRVDTFDGWPVNELTNLNIVVPANGTVKLETRWCSASSSEHNAQSVFSGTDAKGNLVTATGGVVRLLKP